MSLVLVPGRIPFGRIPALFPVTPNPSLRFLTYSVSFLIRFPQPLLASGISVIAGFSSSGTTDVLLSTCRFSASIVVRRLSSSPAAQAVRLPQPHLPLR